MKRSQQWREEMDCTPPDLRRGYIHAILGDMEVLERQVVALQTERDDLAGQLEVCRELTEGMAGTNARLRAVVEGIKRELGRV